MLTVLIMTMTLAGCATTGGNNQLMCGLAGALVGGGGAALAEGDGGAAAAGAAVGALLGYIACNEGPTPKAEPAPAPAPAPAPKPEPEKDSDGDGVLDRNDDCPGTPRGTPVDSRGCPEIPDLKGVNFEFDRDALTPEGMSILDRGASLLKNNSAVRVEIVGHTDGMGSDEYNQRLSERRAETVRAYLESQGISPNRMSTSGRGESAPIASNDTKEGRAENRRVELTARPM
ncbi:MAG: OmpA family protein [Gammaproteobacteria bacterium]|nr:OmpA family protein [Gammaproteobacteria bacterium]